jgi:hypothetical protein
MLDTWKIEMRTAMKRRSNKDETADQLQADLRAALLRHIEATGERVHTISANAAVDYRQLYRFHATGRRIGATSLGRLAAYLRLRLQPDED